MATPEFAGKSARQVLNSTAGTVQEIDPTSGLSGTAPRVGDCMFLIIQTGGADFDAAWVPPAGFTALRTWQGLKTGFTGGAGSTCSYGLYYKFRQVGDGSYTVTQPSMSAYLFFVWFSNVASVGVAAFAGRADAGAGGTSNTAVAPSVSCQAGDTILVATMERTLTAETLEEVIFTPGVTHQAVNLGSEMWTLSTRTATGTSSGTTSVYWPQAHATNGLAGNIVLKNAADPKVGMPIRAVEGGVLKSGWLQIKDGGVLKTPAGVRTINPKYRTVSDMLADPEFFWSHRGGTSDFPEMSLHGYTQSALIGYSVLEFSCNRTSDGVWVGVHDPWLDRTSLAGNPTTQTLDVRNMTWAQVQSYQILASVVPNNKAQPNQPYITLVELLTAYPNHIIVVDGKNSVVGIPQASAHTTELLNILDAHGGPDRIITKSFGTTVSNEFLNACSARGYITWGFFWGFQMANITDPWTVNRWPLLGINFDITSPEQVAFEGMYNRGQRVVAHVISTQAGVNTARAKGFTAFQCQGVNAINPLQQ